MFRTIGMITGLLFVVATGAAAQTHSTTTSQPGHGHAAGADTPAAEPGGAMMRANMMGEMCPIMAPSMQTSGGAMMRGMGMMDTSDPKAMARILRLRGDMMKAMGEVMLKHAQELEQGK